MRKDLLIIALGLSIASGMAKADVLATPEADPAAVAKAPITLPAKGITMAEVQKKFGQPARKRPTVGGDSPKHPPITRWDYDGFWVVFEKDRVIDAVIPGAPPRVYNKDQLTPVAASAAPLPPLPVAPPAETPPAEPIVPEPAPEAPAEAPPAEAAAAPATEPETPAEAPPAEAAPAAPAEAPAEATPAEAPASSYPDAPTALTPAEEVPDQPPTPK